MVRSLLVMAALLFALPTMEAKAVDIKDPENTLVIELTSGEVVIAVGGEWGTLSEIGLARALGRPVVALRSWTLRGRGQMEDAPGVLPAESPRDAVDLALESL